MEDNPACRILCRFKKTFQSIKYAWGMHKVCMRKSLKRIVSLQATILSTHWFTIFPLQTSTYPSEWGCPFIEKRTYFLVQQALESMVSNGTGFFWPEVRGLRLAKKMLFWNRRGKFWTLGFAYFWRGNDPPERVNNPHVSLRAIPLISTSAIRSCRKAPL